jgi:hypothetical protein
LRAATSLRHLLPVIDVSMRSLASLLALAAAALPAGARGADAATVEGTIEVGSGHTEVLSKPLPVGKRIELPEGWFRVEEGGVEDGRVGSFTIMSSSDEEETPSDAPTIARADAPALAAEVAAPARAVPQAAASSCRAERNAYLRQLWKESGIEVSDPDALLEGLDAGSGPATGYYWFAIATDAFRNLAFSSDLRGRAEELVRCIRVARGE